jgi:hypothetical protein
VRHIERGFTLSPLSPFWGLTKGDKCDILKNIGGVMRSYTIKNETLTLLYRYINEGIEITTKYNDKLVHKHYTVDLSPYSEISDLIDDLSYKFLKEEL